jgi:ABC-type multidrug transport system permease subunit
VIPLDYLVELVSKMVSVRFLIQKGFVSPNESTIVLLYQQVTCGGYFYLELQAKVSGLRSVLNINELYQQ